MLDDVRNGKVTPEGARRDYGVVVLQAPWRIDNDATAALRAQRSMTAAAGAAAVAHGRPKPLPSPLGSERSESGGTS